MPTFQSEHQGYLLSTDKRLLQTDIITHFLAYQSYWAKDIPKNIVERSIEHSLCFGIYKEQQQVGYARIISDYATFAYLCDVFIVEEHQGRGLSKWMMECIMQHPDLQQLRRWTLATRDAHELYRKFGFCEPEHPENIMDIRVKDIYTKMKQHDLA